jgi:glucose/mannose-6-phosphate isomerase
MGGSSIAGEVCKGLLIDLIRVPIIIHRNYGLPKFVNKNWAVVAISYSGNTEETLDAFDEAQRRDCQLFVISSGGKISKKSPKNSLQKIPEGFPPRAAFPLILAALLPLLQTLTGLEVTSLGETASTLEKMQKNWTSEGQSPRSIAEKLLDKVPLLIGWRHLSSAAYRAKCQINENAKMAAFSAEMPEASHNEVEAFVVYRSVSVQPVFLRSSFEDKTASIRFEVASELAGEDGSSVVELKMQTMDRIAEVAATIHFLDMVSVELALLRDIDPLGVPNISKLKDAL